MQRKGQVQRQRLLFIDAPEQIHRLALALSEWGCDIETAHSSEAGIATAAWFRPDLIVMELKLPDGPGHHCFHQLRQLLPQARILILTAYPSIASAVSFIKQGAWDYLAKPAEPQQLLSALSRDPSAEQIPAPAKSPSLPRLEWEHIQRVLADCGGNISQAATTLGLHRRSLQRKLLKLPPAE